MQSGGSYLQGYNCQLAVGSDHQVIVATGVSNQLPNVERLEPMLQRIAASAGALPGVMMPSSPMAVCPTASRPRRSAGHYLR